MIDHVIIVVQENRSFDHYVGTYPGADGSPRTDGTWDVCLPDPVLDHCARPYHSTTFFDAGSAHNHSASVRDVNRGKMNGFVEAVRRSGNTCKSHPNIRPCRLTERGPARQPDVMGLHTRAEIPNYWAYADRFVLQDRIVRADRLVDATRAPVPDLRLVGGLLGSLGSDELYAGPERPRRRMEGRQR